MSPSLRQQEKAAAGMMAGNIVAGMKPAQSSTAGRSIVAEIIHTGMLLIALARNK
jgi:hypothetical protein